MERLMRDCRCLPVEKLVLMSIASRGKGTNGRDGFPGINTIAAEAGIDRTTVIRVLRSMRSKGWLSWIPGSTKQNSVNIYTIHLGAIPKKERRPSGTTPLGNFRDLVAMTPKPSGVVPPEALTEASTRAAKKAPPIERERTHANRDPKGVALRKKNRQGQRLGSSRKTNRQHRPSRAASRIRSLRGCSRRRAATHEPRRPHRRAPSARQRRRRASILGAILLDNQAYYEADIIACNDFALDSHRRLFAAIARLMEDGRAVDIVTPRRRVLLAEETDFVSEVAFIASLTEELPPDSRLKSTCASSEVKRAAPHPRRCF